jgi:hypothetical protein
MDFPKSMADKAVSSSQKRKGAIESYKFMEFGAWGGGSHALCGVCAMIDFTRAFDSAWKRTTVILFEPFDLGKWFVIGFSAFLAGLLEGGNGFNGSGSFNNFNNIAQPGGNSGVPSTLPSLPNFDLQHFQASLSNFFVGMQLGIILVIGAVVLVLGFAVILLVYWLGARGQFLFLDNIVRNRPAIAWPWRNYSRQGNSLFLFYLLFLVVSFVLIIPLLIVAVVLVIPLIQHQRWPEGGELVGFVALGTLYFGLCLGMGFVIFVFRELGVPLMFRNGLGAYAAFLESLGLVKQHFLSIFLLVVIRIALFIALAVVSIMACCFTCCLVMVPYLGTVILLPALIYIRCFTLGCLAQFGPQYDVFTVDVAPVSSALNPLPPRG